ncbi:restriction endonuclease [Bacteroides thetaiotaomicron]|jgi:hypothetical protein|uniref:type II restriction endonuclease n=1 Tax=Bacteroides thetaiotaomicron TaxID=818 RepID=UPI001C0149D1|nr:type II restriction endonuclease [Bacteroides thetaiotaomicron]MBT9885894.1 restriction endonuclease [Bacteroides thetaiotaomicron]MCA5979059.1 restriction endonuclease [Bacteroides thetaiotaomicron]
MTEIVEKAIKAVNNSKFAFCKFISANDAGATGTHQEGFYMPKNSIPLMFDFPGTKGENKEHLVKIVWQDDFHTDSRFVYYGSGTRNEYRLTRFGRGFHLLNEDKVGDLFILCKMDKDDYKGYVISTDEDIEDFFATFNLSPEQTNKLIDKHLEYNPEEELRSLFEEFIKKHNDFPQTIEMACGARESYNQVYSVTYKTIQEKPDDTLMKWCKAEYELFKAFEIKQYSEIIKSPFTDVDQLITFANTILNRRKSRAGKSLEHHLSIIFNTVELKYATQVATEENKKPDFIFPGKTEYHNSDFPNENLVCLAAKTTCKDRWRQILNEANRIPIKYLFTLQQGISKNQLTEMYNNNVRLVVPESYIKYFDVSFQNRIFTLKRFNDYVKNIQS